VTQGGTYADANGEASFLIPEFAYKRAISDVLAFDLSIFGNGGMNTTYANANPVFGTTPLTMNLEQAFVAPTFAYKLDPNHAIGISAVLQYQRFKATGLQNFGIMDPGTDSTFGGGARLGYTGTINDWLTVGATYQTRIYSGKFKKYAGLFAEQGRLRYAVQLRARLRRQTVLLAHLGPWTSNASATARSTPSAIHLNAATFSAGLGSAGGPGFGWRDVTAIQDGRRLRIQPRPDPPHRLQPYHPADPRHADDLQHHRPGRGPGSRHPRRHLENMAPTSRFLPSTPTPSIRPSVAPGASSAHRPIADLRMSQDSVGVNIGWNF